MSWFMAKYQLIVTVYIYIDIDILPKFQATYSHMISFFVNFQSLHAMILHSMAAVRPDMTVMLGEMANKELLLWSVGYSKCKCTH